MAADDPGGAEALLHRALTLARSARNRFIEGVTVVSLASAQHRIGTPLAALPTFRAAIQHWLDVADQTHQITTLRNLDVLLRDLDLPVKTAQLLGGLTASHVTTYGAELAKLAAIEQWLGDELSPYELVDARTECARFGVSELARWALTVIDRISSAPSHHAPPSLGT